MENNERMNKNFHICSPLSSSQDDTSDAEHSENSSVLVSCRNCDCNVDVLCIDEWIGNSNIDNKGKGEESVSSKNKVLQICGRQGLSKTDFCDIDLNTSSCNDSLTAEKSSEKSDSPGRLNNKSDSPRRSSGNYDSPDRSSDKPSSPYRASVKSSSPDRSSVKSASPDRSSNESASPDRPIYESASPDRPSCESASPYRSSSDESVSLYRSSSYESASPYRSSDESSSLHRSSSDESDSLDRSSYESASPDRSSYESASSDMSMDETASPNRSSDESASLDKSMDETASHDRSSDKSASPDRSSNKSVSPDRSSDKSASPDRSSDKSDISDSSSVISDRSNDSIERLSNSSRTSEKSLVVFDKSGDNSGSPVMSSDNSDPCQITSVNCSISERKMHKFDISDIPIKETGNSDCSSDYLTDKSTIKQRINYERAKTAELCVKRMLENSKLIRFISNNKSLKIPSTNLNQAIKKPLNTENDGFQGTTSFVNVPGVFMNGEKCKFLKCSQSSICILKFSKENSHPNYKVIYLNKEEKHDEAVRNETNDELDETNSEKVEYIKSYAEYQSNNVTENIQSSDEDGYLKEKYPRMGISSKTSSTVTEYETVYLIEESLDIQNISTNLSLIKSHLHNGKDLPFILNEINCNETAQVGVTKNSQSDNAAQSNCIYENPQLNTDTYSNKQNQVCTFSKNVSETKLSGSQVEDIRQYQNITESGNGWIIENLDFSNQLDASFSSLDILKSVKVMYDSVFDTFQSYINSIISKAKLKISPDSTMCAVTQPDSDETDSEDGDFSLATENIDDEESTTDSDDDIDCSEDSESKTQITNFFTLFKHLTAAAGTDVTAEQVEEDINQQMVLDIYSGFYELRTGDYSNLDLMHKCIQGCLSSMQNTMLKSNDIVKRSGVLLRVETRSFAEMQKLNKDLNQLAAVADDYMQDIDRSLTGLKDFTEDYMYYKDCISKELCEFLVEDFPEMFK